jgi:hypothetical protein
MSGTATRSVIKQLALPDAYGLRGPVPPKLAHVDVGFGCPANLAYNQLKPGEAADATVGLGGGDCRRLTRPGR